MRKITVRSLVDENENRKVLGTGWGSGYIIIEKEHPWYGMSIDEIPAKVHGGITLAEIIRKTNISRMKQLKESDVGKYIIGWDTMRFSDGGKKWQKWRVIQETEKLKLQAIKAMRIKNK